MNHDLKEIYDGPQDYEPYFPVPRDTVRRWMRAGDVRSLSMAHELLTSEAFTAGIEPPLDPREVFSFSLGLMERCIRDDPQPAPGDHDTFTRQRACAEVLEWFYRLWNDDTRQGSLGALKNWLAGLVAKGDADIRGNIYDAFFAKLGESAMRYFSDWNDDTVLAAYLKHYKPKQPPKRRAGESGRG